MRKHSIYGVLLAVVLLAACVSVEFYVRSLGPRARVRAVRELSERFDADVTLGGLQLSLFPTPTVAGGPLSIKHRGWNDPHPLIYISRFTADSTFFNLFFQRDKVRLLRLEGLQIHVPHRGKSASQLTHEDHEEIETSHAGNDRSRLKIAIDTILADDTQLELEPKDARKEPMRFDIRKLELHSVGPSEPLRFKAALNNPRPPGLINTSGRFGPWQKDDPRATAVSGNYAFSNADLSVFQGISGILSSTGTYGGVLQHIDVKGQTDTPDFALKRGDAPVHLRTTFQSTVNGMNGDTILENVDAHFLHSEFICEGDVTHETDRPGKKVTLFAQTKQPARMEDILQLVVGDKNPLMTGDVRFQSKIVIPPGKQDVIDRLQLDGHFNVSSAIFTHPDINNKIRTLSYRARGINKKEEAATPQQTVASDLAAKFKLQNGAMTFNPLSFCIPGALVKLTGNFNLPSRRIDLAGLFRMQSTLSDTQSGIKHWLLKPLDPAFRKDGAGLQLPFKVTGTQDHPTLSVSAFHHTFNVH